jgi:hypothetical protein
MSWAPFWVSFSQAHPVTLVLSTPGFSTKQSVKANLQPGLPALSWYSIPKREKIHQRTEKYTEGHYNVPNGHKLYHLVVKYTKWPSNIPTGH